MSFLGIIKVAVLAVFLAVAGTVVAVGGLIFGSGVDFHGAWQLARLLGTMKFIEERYVDEVDPRVLVDGAIKGMVEALGDPHSGYLDEETYLRLREHTEGSFGGIGIVMGFSEGGKVHVMSVIEDTPAERAGLVKDDEILEVDGESVKGMAPELVAKNVRGQVGSTVRLLVRRGTEEKVFELERDTIHMKTVAGRELENGLGYIRISSFSENSGEEFEQAYNELLQKDMKGLVLDLRANPGGLINSCVKIGNIIVPEGPIVSVVERDGKKEVFNSTHTGADIPVVVLIDHDSASASEIIAGAMQDTGAGVIVGETSYGKGSVQVIMPIPAEADAVKLTIAKYYTPSGRSIHGTGVTPDVEVKLEGNGGFDNQLAKAVEVLRGKMQEQDKAPKLLEGKARNKDAAQL